MANIFTCRLDRLKPAILEDLFSAIYPLSRIMSPYRRCMLNNRIKDNFTANATPTCLHLAAEPCRRSPIRVVKSIRFRLDLVPYLVRRIPDLKVVYYTRDPRGIMFSVDRLTPDALPDDKLTRGVGVVCGEMYQDITWLDDVTRSNDVRPVLVSYERLATHPHRTAREIYRSLGLAVPDRVLDHLTRITRAANESSMQAGLETTRINSTKTATRWRTDMSAVLLVAVLRNRKCVDVIAKLKYTL